MDSKMSVLSAPDLFASDELVLCKFHLNEERKDGKGGKNTCDF